MVFAWILGRDGRATRPSAPATGAVIGRRTALSIAALSFTQIIGWGSLLFMPAVLGRTIQTELAMTAEMAFGGVALMYAVGAVLAPWAGARIDRWGARWVMGGGSLAGAAGLALLAHAGEPIAYFAAWALLGLACACALTNAACAAVAQSAGKAALRGVTALMFVTGLAGTLSLPVIHLMSGAMGWRGTCMVLAALHLCLCLPLHLALQRRNAAAGHGSTPPPSPVARGWTWQRQRAAFPWLAAALAMNVFVTAGFSVHLVGLLRMAGFTDPMAVSLASLVGLAQVAARAVQFIAGGRWLPTRWALAGAALLPLAILAMALPLAAAGRVETGIAVLFVLLLGLSNGLMMVARNTVPVEVFGTARYGAWTGRLAGIQNAATAVTPIAFAAVLGWGGAFAALMLAGLVALASLAALIVLLRKARADYSVGVAR